MVAVLTLTLNEAEEARGIAKADDFDLSYTGVDTSV